MIAEGCLSSPRVEVEASPCLSLRPPRVHSRRPPLPPRVEVEASPLSPPASSSSLSALFGRRPPLLRLLALYALQSKLAKEDFAVWANNNYGATNLVDLSATMSGAFDKPSLYVKCQPYRQHLATLVHMVLENRFLHIWNSVTNFHMPHA
ncbi:hypothetical protein Sjap_010322 [Stephania japonica]|uniref:Uncharacterized protein n=1 Tax=Stephania japonica TaxID=461633 RepID=A0AAP0P6A7_9MAGN